MKKLLFALLLVLVSFPVFAADKDSAFDRVMKTQTIRCGYGTFPPWIYQDLQSGKMTGFSVGVAEALAAQLGFRLDWAEETGWGSLPESLYTGRVDVACSLLWIDPARSKQVAYTRPLFFTPVHAYAREDDTRFTGKTEEIDDPVIRIAVQEGDVSAALANREFSKAQSITSPQSVPSNQLLLDVTTGKADVVFSDPLNVQGFNDAQQKKLKKFPYQSL